MSEIDDKLIKALERFTPEELQQIIDASRVAHDEKTHRFDNLLEPFKQSPSVTWRRCYKDVCNFLEWHYPEINKWWDGWVAEYVFEMSTTDDNGIEARSDLLYLILKRVDQEERKIKLLVTPSL